MWLPLPLPLPPQGTQHYQVAECCRVDPLKLKKIKIKAMFH